MPFLRCRLIIILLFISVLTLTLAKVCLHFYLITFDSFHRWQFLFVNPAYEFPRSTTLVGNFLDLNVEKQSFGGFDYLLNGFQSLRFLDTLYLLRDWLQYSFHYFLECFIMLTFLAFVFQAWLILDASELTTCSKDSWSDRVKISRDLKISTTSLTKISSSSLFFGKESLDNWTNSFSMEIVIVRGIWSEVRQQSGWIEWLLSSLNPLYRNIRLMTKFDSPTVSEYLVGTGLVGNNKSKLNKSAIIKRSPLIDVWWGKDKV